MRRRTLIYFLIGGTLIVIGAAFLYGVGLWKLHQEALVSATRIKEKFRAAAASFSALRPNDASFSLQQALGEVEALRKKTDALGLNLLIQDLPSVFTNVGELSLISAQLATDVGALQTHGFSWVAGHHGDQALATLQQIGILIQELLTRVGRLKQEAFQFHYPLAQDFLTLGNQLYRARDIVNHVYALFNDSEPKHFLILFQNNTEIRPGGGFLGSFAEATLRQGNLIDLAVHDVYDIDGQLTRTIAPPRALQLVAPTWGARDANWFFDFPTSAKKVSELLEASRTYQERATHFVGVIAINPRVMEDLLRVIGPLPLPEYDMTVTADNFLPAIQKEVEAGADNRAGHPKRILHALTPLLFEKLGALTDEQKKTLVMQLKERFINKDIMIYFEDLITEAYLRELGVAGEMMPLAPDFNGDYLAVAHANIAGGKSDLFMKQNITVESHITLQGTLRDRVDIQRRHVGTDMKEWWYTKPNQDFLQIFLPKEVKVSEFTGDDKRELSPAPANKKILESDPEVTAWERNSVLNYTRLSAWLTVPLRQEKHISFSYQTAPPLDLRKPIIFVYEKQSGVDSGLAYRIAAPFGYVWQESGTPVFSYQVENTPSRVVLELHLIQDRR